MNQRTQALAIPPEVKRAVAERDSVDGWPCCIFCGKPAPTDAPTAYSCAHYIPRSRGGLGIEENILTLCPECHRDYDATVDRPFMEAYFQLYLQRAHPDWSEERLVYRKGE